MRRNEILDLDFIEARHKLIDVAAFLDRVARTPGENDFRMAAFHKAISELSNPGPNTAERVLLAFSDLTTDPIPAATTQGTCGAWPRVDSGSKIVDRGL
jgi:hypothetical protein